MTESDRLLSKLPPEIKGTGADLRGVVQMMLAKHKNPSKRSLEFMLEIINGLADIEIRNAIAELSSGD